MTPRRRFRKVHGPTWLVVLAVYGGWALLTLAHRSIPLPALALLGGAVLALHGSLQHETIHGHPAGPRWIGALIASPPLSLWLPYAIYRRTHRQHHATLHLGDPVHDPESPFRHSADWEAMGLPHRTLAIAERTVVGRLLLGPFAMITRFLATEVALLFRERGAKAVARRRAWLGHLALVAIVLVWVLGVAEMPLWKYLVAFVLPGASLTLLRSLAEHRPDADPERRTTVVETGLLFRLLYLNNNLHVIHHRFPHVPWFELPRLWAREREDILRRSPDLVIPGYASVARDHAVRPISPVELPFP